MSLRCARSWEEATDMGNSCREISDRLHLTAWRGMQPKRRCRIWTSLLRARVHQRHSCAETTRIYSLLPCDDGGRVPVSCRSMSESVEAANMSGVFGAKSCL